MGSLPALNTVSITLRVMLALERASSQSQPPLVAQVHTVVTEWLLEQSPQAVLCRLVVQAVLVNLLFTCLALAASRWRVT